MKHDVIVREVARRENFAIGHCARIIDAYLQIVADRISAGERTRLPGVGSISLNEKGHVRMRRAVRSSRGDETSTGKDAT